jgi:hypothetical protein
MNEEQVTKPLKHAHSFQVASSWQEETFMYCAHCGESYLFAKDGHWVRMEFTSLAGRLEEPPAACALPFGEREEGAL